MTDSDLKIQLLSDMKSALKGGDKPRLSVLRLILAAIKQVEVDERITLDEARIVRILHKMSKQRRASITQFTAAGRDDLVTIEDFELTVIQSYLPDTAADTPTVAPQ